VTEKRHQLAHVSIFFLFWIAGGLPMFAFMLESLVLRGSVLRDSVAVGLRLGTEQKAHRTTPGTANPWQLPLPGCVAPDGKPDVNPIVDYATPGFMPGAGRSRRQSGSRLLPVVATIPVAVLRPVGTRERGGR
jgi:hypothetical protein